jgi:LPXTG-motif cell wall-anchored protein
MNCYAAGLPQAPARPPTGDVVETSIDAPGYHAICDYVYELVPPGTLQVRKHADGPAGTRTAPAIIDIRCANTGAGEVVLDADKPGPEPLPEAIRAVDATGCTLGETATGAAPGADHQLRAVVSRNGAVVGGDWQSLALDPGVATEVDLYNTYTSPPAPPTTEPSGGGGRGGKLPKTGNDVGGLLVAGLGCLVVGAAFRALARFRD